MAKAKIEIPLIGGGPPRSREQTPEERIQLAALLTHQLIEGLTGLSLSCSNFRGNLCRSCADGYLDELQSIEQTVASIADLARRLVHCAQPTDGKLTLATWSPLPDGDS
jgi:hypothetical protein